MISHSRQKSLLGGGGGFFRSKPTRGKLNYFSECPEGLPLPPDKPRRREDEAGAKHRKKQGLFSSCFRGSGAKYSSPKGKEYLDAGGGGGRARGSGRHPPSVSASQRRGARHTGAEGPAAGGVALGVPAPAGVTPKGVGRGEAAEGGAAGGSPPASRPQVASHHQSFLRGGGKEPPSDAQPVRATRSQGCMDAQSGGVRRGARGRPPAECLGVEEDVGFLLPGRYGDTSNSAARAAAAAAAAADASSASARGGEEDVEMGALLPTGGLRSFSSRGGSGRGGGGGGRDGGGRGGALPARNVNGGRGGGPLARAGSEVHPHQFGDSLPSYNDPEPWHRQPSFWDRERLPAGGSATGGGAPPGGGGGGGEDDDWQPGSFAEREAGARESVRGQKAAWKSQRAEAAAAGAGHAAGRGTSAFGASPPRPAPADSGPPAPVDRLAQAADTVSMHESAWEAFEARARGGGISSADVPWPLPAGEWLDALLGMAAARVSVSERRRVYYAAALRWHPDKFLARFGALLVEEERDAILQQVHSVAAELNSAWERLK